MTEEQQHHYKSGLRMSLSLRQELLHYSTVLSSIRHIIYVSAMFKGGRTHNWLYMKQQNMKQLKKLQSTKPSNDSADKKTIVQMNVTAQSFLQWLYKPIRFLCSLDKHLKIQNSFRHCSVHLFFNHFLTNSLQFKVKSPKIGPLKRTNHPFLRQ